MADEKRFMEVRGKVPLHDNDGKRVTSDDLAVGGVRRDDGTLSAMAYDLEPLTSIHVESSTDDVNYAPYRQTEDEARLESERDAEAIRNAKAVAEFLITVVPPLVKWVRTTVVPAAREKLQVKKARKQARTAAAREESQDTPVVVEFNIASEPESVPSDALDVVAEEDRIEMSREEARRHYDQLLEADAIRAKKIRILRNARIREDSDDPALDAPRQALTRGKGAQHDARSLKAGASRPEDALIEARAEAKDDQPVDYEYLRVTDRSPSRGLRLPDNSLPSTRVVDSSTAEWMNS